MADLAGMSIDPRSDYEKLNRMEVNRLLDKHGIEHPAFISKIKGVQLLQAHNISPQDGIEWEQVQSTNDRGETVVRNYPKRTQPQRPPGYDELALAEIERQSALRIQEEKDALEKEKDSEINELKATISKMQEMMESLLENRKIPCEISSESSLKKPKETDPYKMKFMAKRKWLKEHGVELKKGDNAKELIDKVLADGEDTLTGNE